MIKVMRTKWADTTVAQRMWFHLFMTTLSIIAQKAVLKPLRDDIVRAAKPRNSGVYR